MYTARLYDLVKEANEAGQVPDLAKQLVETLAFLPAPLTPEQRSEVVAEMCTQLGNDAAEAARVYAEVVAQN